MNFQTTSPRRRLRFWLRSAPLVRIPEHDTEILAEMEPDQPANFYAPKIPTYRLGKPSKLPVLEPLHVLGLRRLAALVFWTAVASVMFLSAFILAVGFKP